MTDTIIKVFGKELLKRWIYSAILAYSTKKGGDAILTSLLLQVKRKWKIQWHSADGVHIHDFELQGETRGEQDVFQQGLWTSGLHNGNSQVSDKQVTHILQHQWMFELKMYHLKFLTTGIQNAKTYPLSAENKFWNILWFMAETHIVILWNTLYTWQSYPW